MKRMFPVLVLLSVAGAAGAWAQTPDGETPSEETVCDGLPGPLFGLCNAYCEAMDCDTGANASDRACERVLANYHRHSGGEDPPCLEADCCEPQNTPSCEDPDCADQVCANLPFCCDIAWDEFCAQEALVLCGQCGGAPPG